MIWFLVSLLVIAPAQTRSQIEFDGHQLTATTANFVAEFRGGDLVRMTNRRTHEQYCHSTTTPFSLIEMDMTEPGQPPLRCTGWRRGGSNRLIAFTTFEGEGRTISMSLAIDPETQDLGITLWGQSNRPGARGIQWALRNLDLSMGRLILPAFGGRYADQSTFPSSLDLHYPGALQAQMTLFESRKGGGFVLYSRDDRSRFSRLRLLRRGDYADVAVYQEASAPWLKADQIRPMEWRLNAFEGDWRVPASGYRNLMRFLRPPPRVPESRRWVAGIRAVVSIEEDAFELALPARLAERLKPDSTLLVLRPSPEALAESEPKDRLRAFASAAKERGFRIGLHTTLPALPENDPDAQLLARWRVIDPISEMPASPNFSSHSRRAILLNPAHQAVRGRLLARLRLWVEALRPDAIYLGASGQGWNDASLASEGRSYVEGVVAFHRAILTAFPGVAVGADIVTEAIHPTLSLSETETECPLPAHPICHFLFGDQTAVHGKTSGPSPDDDPALAAWEAETLEGQGVLPTLRIGSPIDPRAGNPGAERFFRVARAWQEHDLRPDWARPWGEAAFLWTGTRGETAELRQTKTTARLALGDETLSIRVHGAERVVSRWRPAGWPGADETGLLGLDPERRYWLDPPAAAPPVSLAGLATGVIVSAASSGARHAIIRLEKPPLILSNLSRASSAPKTGARFGALDQPLRDGARVEFRETVVDGSPVSAVVMRSAFSGGKTGECFAEYEVILPAEGAPHLEFRASLLSRPEKTSGGTFAVAVNGRSVWKERMAREG